MAQWKIEDLALELQHLEKLESRPRAANIMQRMYASLEAKLKFADGISPSLLLQIMEAVENAKLPSERKDQLMDVLDAASGPMSNMKLTNVGQTMANFAMYLTHEDWSQMEKFTIVQDVMVLLVHRLKLLGVVSMKESLKRQAVALLLFWTESQGKSLPGPWSIYDWVQDFQKDFADTTVVTQAASLATYPANPLALGQTWLNSAYGTARPACKDVPLRKYWAKMPLRSTSHLLKQPRPGNGKADHLANIPTPQQQLAPWFFNFALP